MNVESSQPGVGDQRGRCLNKGGLSCLSDRMCKLEKKKKKEKIKVQSLFINTNIQNTNQNNSDIPSCTGQNG